MRAVMPTVLPDILAWRKRTGADRWDEMWEGELHMPPAPNREHQDIEWALETYLRQRWAPTCDARVYHQINVAPPGGWSSNYRIPDVVMLLPDRFHIDRNEYFEGGPNVVVEIHSPGDESYDKFGFYANLDVPEVWVIDRDSKRPEVYVLDGGEYVQQMAGPHGWTLSGVTGIELRRSTSGKLALRLQGDDSTREEQP